MTTVYYKNGMLSDTSPLVKIWHGFSGLYNTNFSNQITTNAIYKTKSFPADNWRGKYSILILS